MLVAIKAGLDNKEQPSANCASEMVYPNTKIIEYSYRQDMPKSSLHFKLALKDTILNKT